MPGVCTGNFFWFLCSAWVYNALTKCITRQVYTVFKTLFNLTQESKTFLPHHIFIQCKHSILKIWYAHLALLKLKVKYPSFTFHPINATMIIPSTANLLFAFAYAPLPSFSPIH